MSSKLRPEGNVLLGLVIDESGSMLDEWDRVIESYNEFITDVGRQDGERVAVVTQFSDRYNATKPVRMSSAKTVDALKPMTYQNYKPGGNTPLLDAIGETIHKLDKEYG